MNNLNEELLSFDGIVKSLYNEIKTFVNENKFPATVSYDEVTTKQGLYRAYAKVIDLSNGISEKMQSVISASMLRHTYKRLIKASQMPPTVLASYNALLGEISETINILEKLVLNFKQAVENQLRFYGSIQYIMGSPRLNQLN